MAKGWWGGVRWEVRQYDCMMYVCMFVLQWDEVGQGGEDGEAVHAYI